MKNFILKLIPKIVIKNYRGMLSFFIVVLLAFFSSYGTITLTSSFDQNMQLVTNFISTIAHYDVIWTDRLHVGIPAFLLEKEVHLFDNAYGKVNAVYEATIKPNDFKKKVTFHGTNFSILKKFTPTNGDSISSGSSNKVVEGILSTPSI